MFSVTTQANPQTAGASRGAVHKRNHILHLHRQNLLRLTWLEARVCFRRAVAVYLPHVLPQHSATAKENKNRRVSLSHPKTHSLISSRVVFQSTQSSVQNNLSEGTSDLPKQQ